VIAMVVYLGLGAVGVPVFAGGTAGVGRMVGPTGGFLLGFVPAAAIAGWWVESRRAASFPNAFAGMVVAHAAILALGWIWLATSVGPGSAWTGGVAPFLSGAVVKSALAGAAAWAMARKEAKGG
jgi:biotin transport system substrate-specific component